MATYSCGVFTFRPCVMFASQNSSVLNQYRCKHTVFMLCRAIQASLALYQENLTTNSLDSGSPSAHRTSPEGGEADSPDSLIVSDHDLQMALVLSQRECEEAERQRRQEEETLERVLQLSLREKWHEGDVLCWHSVNMQLRWGAILHPYIFPKLQIVSSVVQCYICVACGIKRWEKEYW